MKTTFDLPEELVLELKLRSARERRKLKDVAAQVIRRGLQAQEAESAEHPTLPNGLMVNEAGFPVYRCRSDAPASHMRVEQLIALEQEIIAVEDAEHGGVKGFANSPAGQIPIRTCRHP